MVEKAIIAIDAMGGDNAPAEIVKGCADFSLTGGAKLLLFGDAKKVEAELKKHNHDKNVIEIVNTTQVVTGDDVPTVAIKQKKDSSMVVGLKAVKEKNAHAFVSAGNTGALLTGATLIVGRIKGVDRPAIATLLPNENKTFTLLLDSGANVDVKPEYLLQFAKMGSLYMENVMRIKNPSVGLINIGTEVEKGNATVKEAHKLLSESALNFVGNVEASSVSVGAADVLVCDGFVGNVILKHTEGLSKSILNIIKEELMSTTMSKLGALMAKGAFKNIKKRFDYREIGGAPLLGLNALVVKAHGSSDAKAVFGALRQCKTFIENDIVEKITASVGS